jgi:hypothetical protein
MAQIDRIPGGFAVDGLEFRKGDGNTLIFEGKATAPSTTHNYVWGYRVRQGDIVVTVKMEDTRDNKDFFSGCYPPPLSDFKEKGWQVEEEFEYAQED